MIVDSHVHISSLPILPMPEDVVLESMKKYAITHAVISNADAIEYDFEHNPIDFVSELDATLATLHFCKSQPTMLRGLAWIKPGSHTTHRELFKLMEENKDLLVGFKFHPYHSKLPVSDPAYVPYLEFANHHAMPVAIHTAPDTWSSSAYIQKIASHYPRISFIAVHMDLRSDHKNSSLLVRDAPNVFGDTTWVDDPNEALELIRLCGADKILFGTDNPIDGLDTYHTYEPMMRYLKNELSTEEYEQVFALNAKRLFKY